MLRRVQQGSVWKEVSLVLRLFRRSAVDDDNIQRSSRTIFPESSSRNPYIGSGSSCPLSKYLYMMLNVLRRPTQGSCPASALLASKAVWLNRVYFKLN